MVHFTIADYLHYLDCPLKFEHYYRNGCLDFNVVELDSQCIDLIKDYLNIGEVIEQEMIVSGEQLKIGWYHQLTLFTSRLQGAVEWAYYNGNGIDLYFVSLHTFPSVRIKNRITSIVYLCNQLQIPIHCIKVIYFNEKYVFNGKYYQPKLMFKLSRYLSNSTFDFRLFPKVSVNCQAIDDVLNEMESLLDDGVAKSCALNCKDQLCCLHAKFEQVKLESFNERVLENYQSYGLPKQHIPKIQTLAIANNQNYLDKKALNQWISQICYPIYFFDFEWERKILPWIKGQSLFNDYVFQYSFVKLNKDGSMETKIKIVKENDNTLLFEELISDLQDNGTIFAYNANGAEIMQLMRYAQWDNSLNEKIYKIVNRIVSIDVPLTHGMLYHLGIKGSYSLKNIAQLISFNDYATIECQSGLDAVKMYRDYLKTGSALDEQSLIDYCKADSMAMVALLKWYQTIACD